VCTESCIDGSVDLFFACHVNTSNDVPVVVRHDLFNNVPGEHFLTVDDAGDLQDFARLALEFGLQVSALLAARQVAKDGFVDGGGGHGDAVGHDCRPPAATLEPHPRWE